MPWNGRHLKKPLKIREKCTAVSLSKCLSYCHTLVSYFRVFQTSAIPRVSGLLFWHLDAYQFWHTLSRWWGSFLWLMKINVCQLAAAIFAWGLYTLERWIQCVGNTSKDGILSNDIRIGDWLTKSARVTLASVELVPRVLAIRIHIIDWYTVLSHHTATDLRTRSN